MTQDAKEPILTAVFVDYDNIYLSLKKRSEEAAKRFAKDAVSWLKDIESGRLISATNSPALSRPRRIVVNRCYGNPVPRRNSHDNSTDMTSFPFVRHHFLRAGFEVVDCPPLTAQLKNSSDIKMVLDATDFLNHDTRFDEFLILSGDADFTPLLHRLRAHDRRTVIFANDFTAAAYTALCDGEVQETNLLSALLEGKLSTEPEKIATAPAVISAATTIATSMPAPAAPIPDINALERTRSEIVAAVVVAVKAAGSPVPLEALAERTTRALGHDRTVGTNWAGSSSFIELLRRHLPAEIRLTEQPPYLAYEAARAIAAPSQPPMPMPMPMPLIEQRQPVQRTQIEPATEAPIHAPAQPRVQTQSGNRSIFGNSLPQSAPIPAAPSPQAQPHAGQHAGQRGIAPSAQAPSAQAPVPQAPVPAPQPQAQPRQADMAAAIQASITRIHDACQAPPLSPPDYRALFDAMAGEISENGLQGAQTLTNVYARTQSLGLTVTRDDIRFVMEVVSEADPWFEQGASANLFAGRFRNFVVARCRGQGLNLSGDELDLIDAWFAGGSQQIAPQSIRVPAQTVEIGQQQQAAPQQQPQGGVWSNAPIGGPDQGEQFPKILRTRLRG